MRNVPIADTKKPAVIGNMMTPKSFESAKAFAIVNKPLKKKKKKQHII